jgi:hypothetical protein
VGFGCRAYGEHESGQLSLAVFWSGLSCKELEYLSAIHLGFMENFAGEGS